ncbi:MAG: TerD family protein [Bacteroidales bacterium]|jgi:tellurium resistance protein TerZ|nr:TerD family protein [Bacteroidales bacterium]
MAINLEKKLEKGQRINLEKSDGSKLVDFCVGVNWGAIETSGGFLGLSKKVTDVDLDLSCLLVDSNNNMCDHIYSPLYKPEFLQRYGLPRGKLDSSDYALHHSGDDLAGDKGGDDGLDNEIITVNLAKINSNVAQIFFFLNNVGREDFSQIPYAKIRMYEGTPTRVKEVVASYNISSERQYSGKRAIIMAKLYKKGNEWKFNAIGDPSDDNNLCETIARILKSYL